MPKYWSTWKHWAKSLQSEFGISLSHSSCITLDSPTDSGDHFWTVQQLDTFVSFWSVGLYGSNQEHFFQLWWLFFRGTSRKCAVEAQASPRECFLFTWDTAGFILLENCQNHLSLDFPIVLVPFSNLMSCIFFYILRYNIFLIHIMSEASLLHEIKYSIKKSKKIIV